MNYKKKQYLNTFLQFKLDYLLNQNEKHQIEHTLNSYKYNRNIFTFHSTINCILDTPAKKTIWFHLIPLLEEDDQEYCKRKLFLATDQPMSPPPNHRLLSIFIFRN